MTKKVMVLMGGFSSEREVSLISGKSVSNALQKKGYIVVEHNLTDTKKLLADLDAEKPDVVFNALHGNWGEDGTISALFDLLQIPYTHSGMLASAIGMNKYISKLIAKNSGIRIASSQKTTIKELTSYGTTIDYPYVVKPVWSGAQARRQWHPCSSAAPGKPAYWPRTGTPSSQRPCPEPETAHPHRPRTRPPPERCSPRPQHP